MRPLTLMATAALPVHVLRTHRADGIGLVQDETKYLASGGGFRKKLTSWSVQ